MALRCKTTFCNVQEMLKKLSCSFSPLSIFDNDNLVWPASPHLPHQLHPMMLNHKSCLDDVLPAQQPLPCKSYLFKASLIEWVTNRMWQQRHLPVESTVPTFHCRSPGTLTFASLSRWAARLESIHHVFS